MLQATVEKQMFHQHFRKIIRLDQPLKFIVVVPVAIAQDRLKAAFLNEIVLDGKYLNTQRRYHGELDQNQLKVTGPEGYRKCCFVVEGLVKENGIYGDQTQLDAHITLCKKHQGQLACMLLCLVACCVVMFRWFAVFYIPFFCLFLYGCVQLDFERSSNEIMKLLVHIMTSPIDEPLHLDEFHWG